MKKTMFMFAAALLMVACSNEDVAVNDDVKYVTELKLNFGSGDSRIDATHSTAGLKFAWEKGDEIIVFQNREGYSASVYYVYDESSESFKPKSSVAMQEGTDYFAVMRPSSICNVANEGTDNVQVGLKLDNNISMKELPLISDVFTADASGTIATMHHLVGMVEIPVKLEVGATITTITGFLLNNANDGILGGNFTAKPMSPYIKDTSTGFYYAYENEGPYTLNTTTATSVFIPVLPGTHNGVKLNYSYGESSKQVSLGDITVVRGKITKVAETTVNPD